MLRCVSFFSSLGGALKPYNAKKRPPGSCRKRQKPGGRFHITQKSPPGLTEVRTGGAENQYNATSAQPSSHCTETVQRELGWADECI